MNGLPCWQPCLLACELRGRMCLPASEAAVAASSWAQLPPRLYPSFPRAGLLLHGRVLILLLQLLSICAAVA